MMMYEKRVQKFWKERIGVSTVTTIAANTGENYLLVQDRTLYHNFLKVIKEVNVFPYYSDHSSILNLLCVFPSICLCDGIICPLSP